MAKNLWTKFGEITGRIKCQDSHLTACKRTLEEFYPDSRTKIHAEWFQEAIDKNNQLEKSLNELRELVRQLEDEKFELEN